MVNYYFDTCIWRDYYENRSDKIRPLGEFALALINMILKEDSSRIICSDLVIDELRIGYSSEKIEQVFNPIKKLNHFLMVFKNKEQIKEAWQISKKRGVGFPDVLHCILARDHHAIIITRDKHFEELKDIVEVRKPEELL